MCLLVASVSLLTACETVPRYETAESFCLVLPTCPAYSQEYRNALADEVEKSDTPLQVRTLIDYDFVCKKIDTAYSEICKPV